MSNIDLYPENWETILERKSKILYEQLASKVSYAILSKKR